MITETTVYGVEVNWLEKGVPRQLVAYANATMHEALQELDGNGYLYASVTRPTSRRATFYFQTRATATAFDALMKAAETFEAFMEEFNGDE